MVFLAKEPLSGSEIGQLVGVSKALVSPALGELEKEGLIFQVRREGKFKFYSAHPNPLQTIQNVLKKREASLLEKARSTCLNVVQKSKGQSTRVSDLYSLILTAIQSLDLIIQTAQSDSFLSLAPAESLSTPLFQEKDSD
jgi:DNA-binding transcriptional regulator GbsR (MarR family)